MDYPGKCSIYTWKQWVSYYCSVECSLKVSWVDLIDSVVQVIDILSNFPFTFSTNYWDRVSKSATIIVSFCICFFQFWKFFAGCVLKLCHCGCINVKNCCVLLMTWRLYRYEITVFVHGNTLRSEIFWWPLAWCIFSHLLL